MFNAILNTEILKFQTGKNRPIITYDHLWQTVSSKQRTLMFNCIGGIGTVYNHHL